MDRGYIDFQRLFVFMLSSAFFVVRTKSNVLLQRRYSHPVDKSTGVRSDQTVIRRQFRRKRQPADSLNRRAVRNPRSEDVPPAPRLPEPSGSGEAWRRSAGSPLPLPAG